MGNNNNKNNSSSHLQKTFYIFIFNVKKETKYFVLNYLNSLHFSQVVW